MSRVSPTFISAIRSLPHAVTATMPSNVTPRPKCANAVPQAERGNPMARCNAARKGTRKICAPTVAAPRPTDRRASSRAAAKWYDNHQRNEQRNERRIEERRAYGNLCPDEHLERERIKRSNEHGGACRSQKEIVEHQCTFARNRRE